MSLESHLDKLKQVLSAEDLEIFESLSRRINEVGGNLQALSNHDKELIQAMERKYNDSIREQAINNVQDVVPEEFPMLKTEFATYVKDMLLRELGDEFGSMKAVVNHAFETKWMPSELRNPDVCETLYERFFADIEQANQWRAQIQNEQADLSNKPVAVGLAWFMYIFQLKQWVEQYEA